MSLRRLSQFAILAVVLMVATSAAAIGLRPVVLIVVLLGATAVGLNVVMGRERAPEVEPELPPVPVESPVAKPPAPEVTILAATVQEGAPDLTRVLHGIIADEGGRVQPSEDNQIVALFRGRTHAAAGVHAAQRMLSNVDALRRRIDREVVISIGIGSGLRDDAGTLAAELERLTQEKRVTVIVSAATVAGLGNEAGMLAPFDAEEKLFGFAPVQQTLPGFA